MHHETLVRIKEKMNEPQGCTVLTNIRLVKIVLGTEKNRIRCNVHIIINILLAEYIIAGFVYFNEL